jgi:hypothetical protein
MSNSHVATADLSPSMTSLHGLDGVNFFLAGVLAGFGPSSELLTDPRQSGMLRTLAKGSGCVSTGSNGARSSRRSAEQ